MKRTLIVFVVGILLILAIGGAYYSVVGVGKPLSQSGTDWAEFGNYFGGITGALLSFISILLLVYTIDMQSKQLTSTQYDLLKRDMLTHVTKADDEIQNWLCRQLALRTSSSGPTVEFGDIVWGLLKEEQVNREEFKNAVVRLHVLTCRYCEALGLYRDNVDPYHIFKYHRQKAESLLDFLKAHQELLGQMAGPSLQFCQMHLDGQHEA